MSSSLLHHPHKYHRTGASVVLVATLLASALAVSCRKASLLDLFESSPDMREMGRRA